MELPKPSRRNTVVGDYVLGEEIGKGAHGQVYKAIDKTNGSIVAVKEIALGRLDDAARVALQLEIDLLTELGAHENVVSLRGVLRRDDYVYVVLELAENGSLASLIKPNKFGPLSETLTKVYVRQLLNGLRHVHAEGVVHRDVKGANVLTTKDGVVKIADFGVAARVRAAEPDDHSGKKPPVSELDVQGTPYWMAPEVIEMGGASFASDVWSAGCVVVELLTGQPPYFDMQPMSAMFAIVNDKQPALPSNASRSLRDFLRLCFRKDPLKRPSAAGLLEHEWLRVSSASEAPSAVSKRIPKASKASKSKAASAAPLFPESSSGSEDERIDAVLEWSASELSNARGATHARRKPRAIPPSSPFQDAPVLDGGDGASPVPQNGRFRKNETRAAHAPRVSETPQGDLVALETRAEALTSDATRRPLAGAAGKLAAFLGEIEKRSQCFREDGGSGGFGEAWAATRDFKKNIPKKNELEFRYSPAACDSALERARTADALVRALEDASTSAADAADVLDAASAAIAVTAFAALDPAARGGGGGGGGGGGQKKKTFLGRFAASFCLLGGIPATLTWLATVGDAPVASTARASAARVIASLARGGGVTERCVASCGGLKILAAVLAQPHGYRAGDRATVRHCLDAAFAMCHPDDAYFRDWMRGPSPGEADRGSAGGGATAASEREDEPIVVSGTSALGFDSALPTHSNDSLVSACLASGAVARAGIAPALAALIGALNVAAREEAGTATATSEWKPSTTLPPLPLPPPLPPPPLPPPRASLLSRVVSRFETPAPGFARASHAETDRTASTPSGRSRDAAVESLGRLLRCPGAAGRLARASVFSRSVSSTHAFLGVVGSPATPLGVTRALLRTLRHASRDPAAAAGLRRAGATPKLARFLQMDDPDARESALRALRNVCLLGENLPVPVSVSGRSSSDDAHGDEPLEPPTPSATALEHAVAAGAVPHLVAVAAGDDPRFLAGPGARGAGGEAPETPEATRTDGGGIGAGIANGANGDAKHWRLNGARVSESLRRVAVETLCAAAASGSRICRAKLIE
jgi:serine/threonine protein kinase